jgi:hypothetical protein
MDGDRMSVWAKLIWDGSLSVGETVTAPGYTLGPDSDPTDGWQQYPSIEAAEAALGVTDDPVAALQAQVAELTAALQALIGGD